MVQILLQVQVGVLVKLNIVNSITRIIIYHSACIMLIMSFPAHSENVTAGWVEKVGITNSYFEVHAKLDTGADSSSLNAIDFKITDADAGQYISFALTNREGKTIRLKEKIIRWTKIKNKFGIVKKRPVIQLPVCLGRMTRVVEVNLVDRSNYSYQMLIGRSFLVGSPNILIDSSSDYLLAPMCVTHKD